MLKPFKDVKKAVDSTTSLSICKAFLPLLQTCRALRLDNSVQTNIKANGIKWNEKWQKLSHSSWGFYTHFLQKPSEPGSFSLLITVSEIHHGGKARLWAVWGPCKANVFQLYHQRVQNRQWIALLKLLIFHFKWHMSQWRLSIHNMTANPGLCDILRAITETVMMIAIRCTRYKANDFSFVLQGEKGDYANSVIIEHAISFHDKQEMWDWWGMREPPLPNRVNEKKKKIIMFPRAEKAEVTMRQLLQISSGWSKICILLAELIMTLTFLLDVPTHSITNSEFQRTALKQAYPEVMNCNASC